MSECITSDHFMSPVDQLFHVARKTNFSYKRTSTSSGYTFNDYLCSPLNQSQRKLLPRTKIGLIECLMLNLKLRLGMITHRYDNINYLIICEFLNSDSILNFLYFCISFSINCQRPFKNELIRTR